jgi:hypothetical protein
MYKKQKNMLKILKKKKQVKEYKQRNHYKIYLLDIIHIILFINLWHIHIITIKIIIMLNYYINFIKVL